MKRLGIAVAGAVLAAGLAGGTGFAAGGPGSQGHLVASCAALQARIAELGGLQYAASHTGNTARANQLAAQIVRLQHRFTIQCATARP